MPETKDADFSWREFQARHNNELADILGNFVNRTFTFIEKYLDGTLPPRGHLDALDHELLDRIASATNKIGQSIDNFQFKEANRHFMDLARFANKYFNDKAPWKSRKENIEACATTLRLCVETIYALGILMQPVLPFTAEKVRKFLGLQDGQMDDWDKAIEFPLGEGHKFGKVEIIFTKIDDEKIKAEIDRLQQTTNTAEATGTDSRQSGITIDDFAKINLQIAEIISAEALKGAKKLLKLQVQAGSETRQVIAGIAAHYTPEELVGKQVVLVANLKPATLRGEMSEVMILAASDADGQLSIVTPDKKMKPGNLLK